MPSDHQTSKRNRLFTYNGGFVTSKRIRRILSLSGFDLRLGLPRPRDHVGVWGQSPTAWRGERVASRKGATLIRFEDAFLRSLFPGRKGEPPLGLLVDHTGVHFDAKAPCDLETLLLTHPLDDPDLLSRAERAIEWMKRGHLTKYSAVDPTLSPPPPGYVLVIDQTRGDASVRASGADQAQFDAMLMAAQTDHPDKQIIVKSHPETRLGKRPGYYGCDIQSDRVHLLTDELSPWVLFEGAAAVYTVSSLLGFEAILAGHVPHVFGQPFYASWGLSQDRKPVARRTRSLTRQQLFAAAMILFPKWYDPYHDKLCELEDVLATLEAQSRAWRDDRRGWDAQGISLWKRKHMTAFFGAYGPVSFSSKPDPVSDRPTMIWATKTNARARSKGITCVEDGFLRSRGLGADLVAPLSLVLDDLGIYYDATTQSRLEHLITEAALLSQDHLKRAARLVESIKRLGLSKYNIGGKPRLDTHKGVCILVPGQVEDDASILMGAHGIKTNLDLLKAARAANPNATLLYKPHPDVEAGLRPGIIDTDDLNGLADDVLNKTDSIMAIEAAHEVWTITSLLGFEALLRGRRVTCLGMPFYAGWGLTNDLAPAPERRKARPSIDALTHAVLISYPRYQDPKTSRPCPPEVIVERLSTGDGQRGGPVNRTLAKAQGVLAPYSALWRRQ